MIGPSLLAIVGKGAALTILVAGRSVFFKYVIFRVETKLTTV